MKYIEVDGVGYLIFEDTELGKLYAVKAIELNSKYSEQTDFDEAIFKEYFKEEN